MTDEYLVPTESVKPAVGQQPSPAPFKVSDDMKADFETLMEMLRYRRPANSKSESKFIKRFLGPLNLSRDAYGNLYKSIPGAPILWSSHTDTVHSCGGRQVLGFDKQEVGVAESERTSNCLGADDTAGVWLMQQMIISKVPGLYIFHREEEGGRHGSKFIAKQTPELLKDIKFAIALDRKGTNSIITHQSGSRCCSQSFVDSLARAIDLDFKADSGGTYTDTASYVDLIPECTNISVGYHTAHQKFERLDLDFIFRLRDQLLTMEQAGLVEERKAGEKEYKAYSYSGGSYGGAHSRSHGGDRAFSNSASGTLEYFDGLYYDEDGWTYSDPLGQKCLGYANDYDKNKLTGSGTTTTTTTTGNKESDNERKIKNLLTGRDIAAIDTVGNRADDEDDVPTSSADWTTFCRLIARNPEAVAEILETYGCGYDELRLEIMAMCGVVNI